ncbi:hypothetical protein DPMN_045520 [Dreissena polymorpha]|uniref:Uncharacterized protein n=1 Tax=Dreissena polymorpha TaxID=45954 RepID=A0A9D4I002_DREPO|nr:hypothetical protein DPMN_045518 [Dreissena polymorpha]KAH3738877.1 hypothetical protein DPMN_045520 [Dreissena polymorpha]
MRYSCLLPAYKMMRSSCRSRETSIYHQKHHHLAVTLLYYVDQSDKDYHALTLTQTRLRTV